jgi:hypothetical protein
MKGLIRLSYRKVIDVTSAKRWDRAVFDETYQEFYMQAQQYDQAGTYQTLQELIDNVPKAEQLHYLTSRVAMGYLQQVNQIIPDLLNASGQEAVPFTQFKFEILASDIKLKDAHKIAITFYSDPITWIDTLGNALFVAYGDQRQLLAEGKEVSTDLLMLQPNLTIWSYQPGSLIL